MSLQLQKLYDGIDRLPDPQKQRNVTKRIKGDVVDKEPPRALKKKFRVRAWHVTAELLETNPDWLTSRRVVQSGPLWNPGEQEPSDDEAGKGKKRKMKEEEPVVKVHCRTRYKSTQQQGESSNNTSQDGA